MSPIITIVQSQHHHIGKSVYFSKFAKLVSFSSYFKINSFAKLSGLGVWDSQRCIRTLKLRKSDILGPWKARMVMQTMCERYTHGLRHQHAGSCATDNRRFSDFLIFARKTSISTFSIPFSPISPQSLKPLKFHFKTLFPSAKQLNPIHQK